METNFDSSKDTLLHIKRVSELLTIFATEMLRRGSVHDNSKLISPEKELFDELTPKLAKLTYGSEEYKQSLSELKVALDHHYIMNSHHPEHYVNGVNDMDLFDLVEMAFDWKAATERHVDGDIFKSIEINKTRFKLSDQLVSILNNTFNRLKGNEKVYGIDVVELLSKILSENVGTLAGPNQFKSPGISTRETD